MHMCCRRPVISPGHFRIVTHTYADSFSTKTRFHESNIIFYFKNEKVLQKTSNCVKRNIKKRLDVVIIFVLFRQI